MKKTTYAIIAAIVLTFLIGIGVAAYAALSAEPYTPMHERVPVESYE